MVDTSRPTETAPDKTLTTPTFPLITINELRGLIETEFTVDEAMEIFGNPSFTVRSRGSPKKHFELLVQKTKPYGILPFLRERQGKLVIQVLTKPKGKTYRIRTNIIFFFATLATVFLAGYFNALGWAQVSGEDVITHGLLFTAALMAIVGLHEFGHKFVCLKRKIEATFPYFIPGPPFPIGFGTFGAVIMQKEPPVNRDHLFDLGFSGPITGFIVTLIVTYLTIPMLQVETVIPTDALTMSPSLAMYLLIQLFRPTILNYPAISAPPMMMAAWLGFVITFLNLLPIWQLDGGHIARAMFGERGLKVASIIGMAIAILTGFFFFAILILVLMRRRSTVGSLDNVSPLSSWRRMLGIVAYAMLALSAVLLW